MTRTVLVTGGAGFIGSNIVAELTARGDVDVIVCDRLRSADGGKWRNLAKHPLTDIVPPEALFEWLGEHGQSLEAVIHMGAISSTREPDVDLIIAANFSFSKDLFHWCAANKVRLIYASSAAVYGDGAFGFDDDPSPAALDALRPLNPYGWSKLMFDRYAVRLASRGVAPPQLAGLRFFNVYGPNEYHKGQMRSVVAGVWPAVAIGEAVRLFRSYRSDVTDGGQLRDFVYVADVARVVAWLFDHAKVEGIFNVGSGQARSFADLASATFAAAGQTAFVEYIDMPDDLIAQYQYFTEASLGRLRHAGYAAPFTSLEDGVGDYVTRFLATDDPYR